MKLAFWKKEKPAEEKADEEPEEAIEQKGGDVLAELNRLKVKVDSLDEIRKATTERFSRVSEQIGELRGIILDTNRTMSETEVRSTKTADLVQAVQPDKLMAEVRRTDAKIEATRANIESNEAMMKSIMSELKELRNKLSFFRGLEQVVKLNDDIKKELTQVQKTKAVIERHADKSETIFSEMQGRFAEMDKFTGTLKDLQNAVKQLNDAVDTLKVQTVKKADRQEVEKLVKKLNEFEVHVGNVIDLMSRKAKELNDEFKSDVSRFHSLFDLELHKGKKVLDLIENLAKENPNVEKNVRVLREIDEKEREQAELEKIQEAVPVAEHTSWLPWKRKQKPNAR